MFKDNRPGKWALLAFLLLLILSALIIFFGLQAHAEKAPVALEKKTERVLPIKEVTSPGGIKAWIVEDHSLPIVALKFYFRDSGAALDPDDKQGLARLLSNTMDEGAGNLDSEAFQKAMNDNSISLSFSAGRDGFGGSLETLARHKAKAFELLSLAVTSPRFDDEAVVRMKEANLARIRSSLSDPDWIAARLMNDRAFEGHPYAKNSGGTVSGLEKITPADLRQFKDKYLTKDRLFIAASGDITKEEFGRAVDSIFGKLPAKTDASALKDAALANGGKVFVFDMPVPQTVMSMAIPSFDHTDKDFYALQVMNYIYGGAGFGSRLMENAREKNGLTYGIYSSLDDARKSDILSISTSTKNETAGQMLKIVRDEMTRMTSADVEAKELADAKAYLTGSVLLALTSTEDIAGAVLGLQVNDYPADYLDTYKSKIEAVTPADIRRVAGRVLDPAKLTTILVGKPEKIENATIIKEIPNVR